jgi:hypothetical protein
MARGKVKGKVKVSVKKRPVKAGRTMPKNIGGIANAKIVATVEKIKSQE